MVIPRKHVKELHELFASIQTEEEAKMLLADILTPQELASVAERWQLVQQLYHNVPQREIAENLDVSLSKITRGSRMLQFGCGGFEYFLKKLKK